MEHLAETHSAAELALEINTLTRQARTMALTYICEIGNRLLAAKDIVPRGDWGAWLRTEVDYSVSTAHNYMRIAQEYSPRQATLYGEPAKTQALGNLSYTQALALLAVPVNDREAFAAEVDAEHKSESELREAIRARDEFAAEAARRTKETEELTEIANKLRDDLEAAMAYRSRLESRVEELREQPVVVEHTPPDPAEVDRAVATAVEDERRKADDKIAELKTKIKAIQAARDRAEDNATSLKKSLEDKLTKREKEVASATAALDKTEAARRQAEASAAQATARAEELQRQIKTAGNPRLTAAKIFHTQMQEAFDRLAGTISDIAADGGRETAEKLVAATRAAINKMLQKTGTILDCTRPEALTPAETLTEKNND